jgi:cysteine desulfurase
LPKIEIISAKQQKNDIDNIFISTGSACNSEIALPSHVLTACKADLENYSPIRISLGKYNTKEEIDIFVQSLINIVNMIRRRG